MGKENSSVTRVWPVLLELMCNDRKPSESLGLMLDLAFKASGNVLAKRLQDHAGPVLQDLVVKPATARTEYGLKVRLPRCFEYSVPPTERFLLWLIEHTGDGCLPKPGLNVAQRNAGRRPDLFGDNQANRDDARKEAIRNLGLAGTDRSRNQWWTFEGPTSVDCFLETSDLVLLIEGKRTDSVAEGTDWCRMRNQIARNLEAAQSIAHGKRYAVLLAAEEDIDFSPAKIASGFPHMNESEKAFLADHYIGCITWKQICEAACLTLKLDRDFQDVESAQRWLQDQSYID
ncbi:MAG: hypothetical protein ABSD31_04970 [Candidatus Binataceae bacterium]|jgi:hypothetical protein